MRRTNLKAVRTPKVRGDAETIAHYARHAVYAMHTAGQCLAEAGDGDQDPAATAARYAVAVDFWFYALNATAKNLETALADAAGD